MHELMHSDNQCTVVFQQPIEKDEKFIAKVEQKVVDTVEKYGLIKKEDKLLVAVSGGKDSTACLSVLHKYGYPVEAFTVDVHIGCYTKQNLENVKTFCSKIGVKLHVFTFREIYGHSMCSIRDIAKEKGLSFGSCTVCGVLRRRVLNMAARETGATKIATGHNMDDEVQSVLMNLFKNRQSLNARLGPKPGLIQDEGFVQRIKPLYFVREKDIALYSKMMEFPVQYGRCPCSQDSTRYHMRKFLDGCDEIYPNARENAIQFFLKVQPKLAKKYGNYNKPQNCTKCGEPSSTPVCRSCQILNTIQAQ